MFIQVIQGPVADEAALRAGLDRWERDLMPGAVGYLGTTAGITDDGMFVALARFESAEAARRNSERPEQGAWWADMERCFSGPVSFVDSSDVFQMLAGGSDGAGFVQVVEGHSPDLHRMEQIMASTQDRLHEERPEIIGGLVCDAGDGRYVSAMYFTSEAEARAHETMAIPDDVRDIVEEEFRLMGDDITYLDLHRPLLVSAHR